MIKIEKNRLRRIEKGFKIENFRLRRIEKRKQNCFFRLRRIEEGVKYDPPHRPSVPGTTRPAGGRGVRGEGVPSPRAVLGYRNTRSQ